MAKTLPAYLHMSRKLFTTTQFHLKWQVSVILIINENWLLKVVTRNLYSFLPNNRVALVGVTKTSSANVEILSTRSNSSASQYRLVAALTLQHDLL